MKTEMTKTIKLISGSIHPNLALAIADKLSVKLTAVQLDRYANGEISCRIDDSVRGADVFVIQTHGVQINDAIMEQAIVIDAAKRASARRITAVCPFIGYMRQDRKGSGRAPITARLVIDILKTAGADQIVTVDLHSGQIQGFFDGPFDHLIAMPVLLDHLQKTDGRDCVIVAPDAGRVKLAERYVSRLDTDIAIFHKRRTIGNQAEALHLVGEVNGRKCIIIDDMIDGAGTVCAAAKLLQIKGASSVVVYATHGIFSDPAAKRLAKSNIDRIVVTDTLPPTLHLPNPKLEIVSIVPLLADAIEAIFKDRSVSDLFDGENQV